MNKTLDIIMDIGEQLLISGAEVSRVEESVQRMGSAFGSVRSDAFIITSSMEVTLHDTQGNAYTQTRRVSNIGTDIERLHRLNALVRNICAGGHDIASAEAELKVITETKRYPFFAEVLSYGGISGAFTIFFGGGVYECICSLLIGLVLAFIIRITELGELNKIFAKFFCSFAATLLAFAALKVGIVTTADNIIIGNIMTLIPGVGLTVALRDLFVGDSITGVLRTIEAVLFALAIAGGYLISALIMGGAAV